MIVDGPRRRRARAPRTGGRFRRVVIEKPFGHDLAAPRALNAEVHQAFEERQVFRIDHYLGKETVQNILVFRFANGIFEPVWNRNFVDHVQITVAESIGVEGRGRLLRGGRRAARHRPEPHAAGAVRSWRWSRPRRFDAEAVRDESVKVLGRRAGRCGRRDVVRGQYAAGLRRRRARAAATARRRASRPTPTTETYVARASAHRQLALGRHAVLPAHRQAAAEARHRGRDPVQARAAPAVLVRRGRAARAERAGAAHPADEGISLRFGAKVPADAHPDPHREHGLPVRHGVLGAAGRGVRDAAARRDARRRAPTSPARTRSRSRGGSSQPLLDAWQRAGRRARTCTRPAPGARRRPTSCSPATARRWRRP